MSKMTGPVGRRKAEGYRVGAESWAGCAGRHDVWRAASGMQANKSGIDDAFEVVGVAPAEIAVVDADRRDPGITVLDFGQAPPDSEKSPPSLPRSSPVMAGGMSKPSFSQN